MYQPGSPIQGMGGGGKLTTVSARSSASSFSTVLTVEYRIGLEQPARPRAYQATNLFFAISEPIHQEGRKGGRGRKTNFRAFGMYHTVMQMDEKMDAVMTPE